MPCVSSQEECEMLREKGEAVWGSDFVFFVEVFGIWMESWLHRFCNEQRAPWLFRAFEGPYGDYFINPYEDPYQTTRIQWQVRVFFLAIWKLVLGSQAQFLWPFSPLSWRDPFTNFWTPEWFYCCCISFLSWRTDSQILHFASFDGLISLDLKHWKQKCMDMKNHERFNYLKRTFFSKKLKLPSGEIGEHWAADGRGLGGNKESTVQNCSVKKQNPKHP